MIIDIKIKLGAIEILSLMTLIAVLTGYSGLLNMKLPAGIDVMLDSRHQFIPSTIEKP
jgi:hypothetical protein